MPLNLLPIGAVPGQLLSLWLDSYVRKSSEYVQHEIQNYAFEICIFDNGRGAVDVHPCSLCHGPFWPDGCLYLRRAHNEQPNHETTTESKGRLLPFMFGGLLYGLICCR